MRISLVAVSASILFSLGFGDSAGATRLHHRLTVTELPGDVAPELRSEIHIIENADLKHIFKVNRITGQVSECDYDTQKGTLKTCAVQGYDAGPQKWGYYVLENADLATAVYRVELKTRMKTICAISNGRVFCVAAIN